MELIQIIYTLINLAGYLFFIVVMGFLTHFVVNFYVLWAYEDEDSERWLRENKDRLGSTKMPSYLFKRKLNDHIASKRKLYTTFILFGLPWFIYIFGDNSLSDLLFDGLLKY